MDSLKQYIIKLPQQLSYKDAQVVKLNVFKALYWAVSGEGDFFDELFNGVPEEQIRELRNYLWKLFAKSDRKPFYANVNSGDYSHPKEQICGYRFKEGDAVYRCEECCYDETCVICSFCFNKNDHINHNVSFYNASSSNEGMCDCGDEAAFLNTLNCGCQKPSNVEPNFRQVIHDVLDFSLQYCLDVANFSIGTLPFIHENLNNGGPIKLHTEQLSDFGSLPVDQYKCVDENTAESWYLVLWNDENHNYDEARAAIRSATGVSKDEAQRLARLISSSGRAVLKEDKKPQLLLSPQKLAEADGLVATILSRRDYVREMIVGAIFSWICEVTSFNGNSAFREECKRQLAAILLESNFQFSKTLSSQAFRQGLFDLRKESFKSGLVIDGVLEDNFPTMLSGESTFVLDGKIEDVFEEDPNRNKMRSRLQYLLMFEIRFPLRIRKLLTRIILTLLGGDRHLKEEFARQYCQVYPQHLIISALSDREENLSCMDQIRVQLFTCPITNEMILFEGHLPQFLIPLSWLIENHAAKLNPASGFLNLTNIIHDLRSKREKSSIQRAIFSAINDITHILGKNRSQNLLNTVVTSDSIYSLLSFVKYFQGAFPITRKLGDHVSQEQVNEHLLFLETAVPIYYIMKCASLAESPEVDAVVTTLRFILNIMHAHEEKRKSSLLTSDGFKVSSHAVSFINPMNSFVSFLAQHCSLTLLPGLLKDEYESLISLADFSLRSIVLASQVKIGLWIRNGATVSRQATYYSEGSTREALHFRTLIPTSAIRPLGDLAYHRDLHIIQLALMCGQSTRAFELLVKRWELQEWFSNKITFHSTVYEERIDYLCEQFVKILYLLFTDRTLLRVMLPEDNSKYTVEKIAYALCGKPKSFTDLVSEIHEQTSDISQFEEQLLSCASLQSPTGINDSGVYRLKPEFFERLDPMSSNLDASQFETINASLLKNLARIRGVKEDSIIITPCIKRAHSVSIDQLILDFFCTNKMAKLIYKLLLEAINSDKETYILQLLHLLHAILVDIDASGRRSQYLESFIDIPVCDLLLTIAESTMSKPIVAKADYLLFQLVESDARVTKSLLDCFGETYFENFKKRRSESSFSQNEKRKGTAEKRKSKILKKLAKQQRSFQAQNDFAQSDSESKNSRNRIRLRSCVICGEQEGFDKLFGVLLCTSLNSVFWKLPAFDDEFSMLAFLDFDSDLPRVPGHVYSRGYPFERMKEKGLENIISGSVATSCCHGIHFECYSRQRGHAQVVPCLLCHNFHDSFLPSFLPPLNNLSGDILKGGSLSNDSSTRSNISNVARSIIDDIYWKNDAMPLKRLAGAIFRNHKEANVDVQRAIRLSRLIANTIRANEISTRVDGNNAYCNYLEQILNQTRMTLLSLMQLRCYLALFLQHYHLPQSETSGEAGYAGESSIFNTTIIRFFEGESSALHLIKEGVSKLITLLIPELVNDIRNNHHFLMMKSGNINPVSRSEAAAYASYIKKYLTQLWTEVCDGGLDLQVLASFLNNALQRIVLTYLRQCSIFWDILTGTQTDSHVFASCQAINELKSSLKTKEGLDSLGPLLAFFKLPTLMEFVQDMISENPGDKTLHQLVQKYTCTKYFEERENLGTLIDFPGRISLIEIPNDFNLCVIDPIYNGRRPILESICLSCGTYLDRKKLLLHSLLCCLMPVFFTPSKNYFEVFVQLASTTIEVRIPMPYLTTHGEVKRPGVFGKAHLNYSRYNHLNKLWLNQEIYGFVTRSLFDGAGPRIIRPDAELFNNEIFEGSDSEGEFVIDTNLPFDILGPGLDG